MPETFPYRVDEVGKGLEGEVHRTGHRQSVGRKPRELADEVGLHAESHDHVGDLHQGEVVAGGMASGAVVVSEMKAAVLQVVVAILVVLAQSASGVDDLTDVASVGTPVGVIALILKIFRYKDNKSINLT